MEQVAPAVGNILIYNGPGANSEGCRALENSLKAIAHDAILSVGANLIRDSHWEHTTSLLVIPGGVASEMDEALQPKGMERIYLYVTKWGGKALLICAGFYLFSTKSNYTFGDTAIVKKRPFPLFRGIAEGPITRPDVPTAINITLSDGTNGSIYSQGGPIYHPESATTVVATFTPPSRLSSAHHPYLKDPTDSAAVVAEEWDDGKVIGVSPHFEFSYPKTRSPDEPIELTELYDQLEKDGINGQLLDAIKKELNPT